MENLKKVYTYTIHIHNVYTGLFGRNVRETAKKQRHSLKVSKLYRCFIFSQNSRLSAFSRKYFMPMMTKPSSLRHGLRAPFTMTIFLNESGIWRSELNSCACFSSEVRS